MREILAARALFLEANQLRRSALPFRREMAVLFLHDAVELVAFTAAKSVNPNLADKASFDSYWDAVSQSQQNSSTPKLLPYRPEMARLNKARVGFKHHAISPNLAQIPELEDDARRFLVITTREFFGLDFETLSEIDLIADSEIRPLLKEAEASCGRDEIEQALYRMRDALDVARERIRPFLLWPRFVRPPSSRDEELRAISSALEHMGKAIVTIEFYIEGTLLGIHPAERALVEAFLPGKSGKQYAWRIPVPPKEIAEQCIRTVTRFALAAERFIDGADLTSWSLPENGSGFPPSGGQGWVRFVREPSDDRQSPEVPTGKSP